MHPVAGVYAGYSEKKDLGNSKSIGKDEEKLTITQTLISTHISGVSSKEGVFYSKWNGKMVDAENGRLKFLVTIETPRGDMAGMMSFNVMGDELNGFGRVIEPGENHSWSFMLKREK